MSSFLKIPWQGLCLPSIAAPRCDCVGSWLGAVPAELVFIWSPGILACLGCKDSTKTMQNQKTCKTRMRRRSRGRQGKTRTMMRTTTVSRTTTRITKTKKTCKNPCKKRFLGTANIHLPHQLFGFHLNP